jgi:hypothetical protein
MLIEVIEDESGIASEVALKDLDIMAWMWGLSIAGDDDKLVGWSDLKNSTDQCEFISIRGTRRSVTSVLESVVNDVSLLAAVIYM